MNTTSSSAVILLGLVVSGFFLPLRAAPPNQEGLQAYEAVEPHMGTLFRIKVYAANSVQAENGFRAAFARISQLDDELSDYKADSELSRLSQTAVRHATAVSDDLLRVLTAAQNLTTETEGAFDVTLGPVTGLWRAARKAGNLPDPEMLRMAGQRCGYRKLKLDASRHTVELDEEGMKLDVGGIAKGFAADEALMVLQKIGISSALVAASGDLTFSDAPPGKAGWTIGIDSLDETSAPFTRVLVLSNGGISSSGDTEQFIEIRGKRYSHIIDPKTSFGLTNQITATVIARAGIVADSVATTLCVLGESHALQYIEGHADLAALVFLKGRTPSVLMPSRNFVRLAGAPGTQRNREGFRLQER